MQGQYTKKWMCFYILASNSWNGEKFHKSHTENMNYFCIAGNTKYVCDVSMQQIVKQWLKESEKT